MELTLISINQRQEDGSQIYTVFSGIFWPQRSHQTSLERDPKCDDADYGKQDALG